MKTAIRIFIFTVLLPFVLYQKADAVRPHTTPSSPVESGIATTVPGDRCGAGKVELHATAHNPADTIKWYSRLSGGSLLGKGESWTTPVISSTTIYYVSASKKGSAASRKAVKATVNALPAAVISPAAASFCEGGSVKLSVTAAASAVEWSTGATTTAITVQAAGNYTVHVSNSSGCNATSPVTAVTATPHPHIVSITPGMRCDHGQMPLVAKANAGVVKWYTSNTAIVPVSTGTLYFTPTIITPGTTTYYAEATDKGCVSERIAIPATMKAVPSLISTMAGSRSGAGTLVLKASPNKGVINWYAHAAGGAPLATDSAFTTPALSATTTYYVEASLDGCSSGRESVVATVNNPASTAGIIIAGFENALKPSISISPNPNKGEFKMTASGDMIYIVNNESKVTVAEGRFNSSNNHTLEMKGFSSGEYHFIGYNKSALVKEKISVSK